MKAGGLGFDPRRVHTKYGTSGSKVVTFVVRRVHIILCLICHRKLYNELIQKMMKVFLQRRNQYDQFLHKIQQPKMKELWNNTEDEAWEHA